MDKQDIRWMQRFKNYQKALKQLEEAVNLTKTRELSNLEKQGMIQAFEYTHELAWKMLKDFLKSRGNAEIYGSRDATREAFQLGIIDDGQIWMKMIQSRNLTSHIYDEGIAEEMIELIIHSYFQAFEKLQTKINSFYDNGGIK